MIPVLLLISTLSAKPPVTGGVDRDLYRSSQASWSEFNHKWGTWFAHWNEDLSSPEVMLGTGVLEVDSHKLLLDVAALARVPVGELIGPTIIEQGSRRFFRWQRFWNGIPVDGDELTMVSEQGKIHTIWIRLHQIRLDKSPLSDERIFIDDHGQAWLTTLEQVEGNLVYRLRDGTEIERRSEIFHDVQVSHLVGDLTTPVTTSPAKSVKIVDGDGNIELTDSEGTHTLEGDLTATLTSPALQILSYDPGYPLLQSKFELDSAEMNAVSVSGVDSLVFPADDHYLSAGSVHHYVHLTLDWLRALRPNHRVLLEGVQAYINIPLTETASSWCNNWYYDGGIYFTVGAEGSFLPGGRDYSCLNGAHSASIIVHELGHGVHDRMLVFGAMHEDVGEGSADYIQATVREDPVFGANFYYDTVQDPARDISEDRIAPDDFNGSSHNDGRVWSSWLWNLREEWAELDGGVEQVDELFLRTIEVGPRFKDLGFAVLSADDDNGDLSDGTPNGCHLVDGLKRHGIVPTGFGLMQLQHAPLPSQASATENYPINVELQQFPSNCSGQEVASITLWYTTDESLSPLDRFEWDSITTTESNGEWQAVIPRQPANSLVRYFFSVEALDDADPVFSHGGFTDGVHSFLVGDQAELNCEDFEQGAAGWAHGPGAYPSAPIDNNIDEWEIGEPDGTGMSPTSATSGTHIAGTNLEGNYRSSNASHLIGPVIELHELGMMRFLSYQRFLSVEDGLFDQASIAINQQPIWQNPVASRPTDGAVVDGQWRHQLIRLPYGLDSAQFTWSLRSDAFVNLGGWAIDDVCIVELANPVEHYNQLDLMATETDAGVELSWTVPWIRPITGITLVRKAGQDLPVIPLDGETLIELDELVSGAVHNYTDSDILADRDYVYAAFISGVPDSLGVLPLEWGSTALHIKTSNDLEEDKAGCSSTQGNQGTLGTVVLLMLLSCRRRQ